MTPTKRKLLSVLAEAYSQGVNDQVSFRDLFLNFPNENPASVFIALTELQRKKLVFHDDTQHLYCITPAGRAALIPERSV